jgi:hypothetical protein
MNKLIFTSKFQPLSINIGCYTHTKDREYQPYLVLFRQKRRKDNPDYFQHYISVHKRNPEFDDDFERSFNKKPVYKSVVERVWKKDTEMYFIGILLEIEDLHYVYIGEKIIEFFTKQPIIEYHVYQDSDKKFYPYVISSDNRVYLINLNVWISKRIAFDKEHPYLVYEESFDRTYIDESTGKKYRIKGNPIRSYSMGSTILDE